MDDKTSMEAIAERMKSRRKELGYSYQDLAHLTGMNKSSLQRYETGTIANVPLHRLQILASALQVSPSWLMGWSDTKIIKKSNKTRVGQNISHYRKKKDLTTVQLAKLCELTENTIKSYEEGDEIPDENALKLIANVLGTKIEILAGKEADYEFKDFDGVIDPNQVEILKLSFAQLNHKGVDEAVKRVKELSEISDYKKENSSEES